MDVVRLALQERVANLEEERVLARREADEHDAEVEALKTQVRGRRHTAVKTYRT